MNNEKCWKKELRGSFVTYTSCSAVVSFIAYIRTQNAGYSLIMFFITAVIVVMRLFFVSYLFQNKLLKDFRYRQPLLHLDGVVVEKHLHVHPQTLYRKEWITFETADGEQRRFYSSAANIGEERRHLSTFSVGHHGTLYYRKGKKFDSFEEFVHEGVVAEE